jgi:hypothetical protein
MEGNMNFLVYEAIGQDGVVVYAAIPEGLFDSQLVQGGGTFDSFLPLGRDLRYRLIAAKGRQEAIAKAKRGDGCRWRKSRFGW